MPFRVQRVQSEIMREVSLIIHDELRDPRVKNITVTGVKMAADLRNATVFYSVLGDEADKKKAHEALIKATSFIRKEIGKRINLKYNPEFRFEFDISIEKAARISALLNKAKQSSKDESQSE